MKPDEIAIRDVIATWMSASRNGDTDTTLSLLTDDVVFMVPGHPPFGKDAFAAMSQAMRGNTIDAANEIMEIEVSGHIAFVRNRLTVTVTPQEGASITRSGYALSIYRKGADGLWRLARDANVMAIIA